LSSLRIANASDYKVANQAIENQCKKLVEIIENAKRETAYENEARYRASDDGHKALLGEVERA
jgi:hemerythrin